MAFPVLTRTMAEVDSWWKPNSTPVLLEALFAQGHTYKRLAELLGAPSDKAVFAHAKALGLPEKYPRGGSAVAARKATLAAKTVAEAKTVPSGWPKTKSCLKCRSPFSSRGPGNSLCPACRDRNFRATADMGGLY